MTPSEIITEYGEELSDDDIDDLYNNYARSQAVDFTQDFNNNTDTIRVVHTVWKSLRKIGFLKFIDPEGVERETIVNEDYELNEEQGDIEIRWDWILEVHEGTKIGADKYTRLRPLPNQYKDLDTIYDCKLPYIGAAYDNTNSEVTSLVDRMRSYQYLYNIIMYRVELLLAQDKGKKVIFNMNAIPKSAGISLEKFEYFLDTNSYSYMNPSEEGNKMGGEVTNLVKEIDLSNSADIAKYIELADYLDRRAGESVGVNKQLEGQIQEREAVSNVQSSINLSTNILESYFQMHDEVKKNVLTSLIECAKVVYSKGKPRKLSYIMDDMTVAMLSVDQDLLDSSTYGVFVSNSYKGQETKDVLVQLAHAAMQNDRMDLSTVVKVLQADSIQSAEELLLEGEDRRSQQLMQQQESMNQHELQITQMNMEFEREKMRFELEKIRLEEKLKKEREIAKQAILAMGFYDEKDVDSDGRPDVVEFANTILDRDRLKLDEKVHNDDMKMRGKEIEVKKMQVKAQRAKAVAQKKKPAGKKS